MPRPVESTHFTRSVRELGVQQIFARSPQAKGRMERAAGTFQDRLVTELRLAGATTIAQANQVLEQFIPRFNAQFGVTPQQLNAAYRPVDPAVNLTEIRCFKNPRKVAKDNTVKYQWRTLQMMPSEDRLPMQARRSKCLNCPTAVSRYSISAKPFLPGRRRGVQGRYGPPAALLPLLLTSDGL